MEREQEEERESRVRPKMSCSRSLRTSTIKNLTLVFNTKTLRTRALVLTTSSYLYYSNLQLTVKQNPATVLSLRPAVELKIMPDLHVIRLIVNRKVRWIAARLALTALVLRSNPPRQPTVNLLQGLSAAAGAESSVSHSRTGKNWAP